MAHCDCPSLSLFLKDHLDLSVLELTEFNCTLSQCHCSRSRSSLFIIPHIILCFVLSRLFTSSPSNDSIHRFVVGVHFGGTKPPKDHWLAQYSAKYYYYYYSTIPRADRNVHCRCVTILSLTFADQSNSRVIRWCAGASAKMITTRCGSIGPGLCPSLSEARVSTTTRLDCLPGWTDGSVCDCGRGKSTGQCEAGGRPKLTEWVRLNDCDEGGRRRWEWSHKCNSAK